MNLNCSTKCLIVADKGSLYPIGVFLSQFGAALDVGEEECDGSGQEFRHVLSPPLVSESQW